MSVLKGYLARGLGQAGDLTQIEWVRRQLIDLAGIDPHPGTLNLTLYDQQNRAVWQKWRELPGEIIEPPDPAFCRARCLPVRIEGVLPAAVLIPEVPGYPVDKVELVAALPVRLHLALADGARVRVELCRPLAAKAVLFDLDGTLIDSIGAYHEVGRVAAQQFGFEVTREHVRFCMSTGVNFWKGVIPVDHPDRDVLARAMSAHAAREWPRILKQSGAVFEGVAQTLDALKSRGLRLGIVSGARPEVMELIGAQGLLERFDTVVMGPDVAHQKPDPEGINTALKRLEVPPELALYIGDTPIDIQASRSAGVRVVGVLTGAGDCAQLSAHGPDRILSSHRRLPGIVTFHNP